MAALCVGGCDCSGSVGKDTHGSGTPCTMSSECPVGELCIDGHCGRMGGGECASDVDRDGYGEGCDLGPDCDEGDPSQTGVEICDGWDNDCDGEADNGVLSSCGDCDSTCMADGAGAGTMTPWDVSDSSPDESEGVGVDDEGALVLDSHMVNTHFIWIANTSEGTVSKVDTRTYVEVARYVTGPDGTGNDPSRTSVNAASDVYVGNRAGRTVSKISALGAECPDTNGDGVVTTSTGPTDVLAWGMDDCVLWNTRLPDGGIIRAVAAQDVEGLDFTYEEFVWIGGWEQVIWKLDGDDGSIVLRTASPTYNYGFALDGNGQLWISGRSSHALGRVDTTRCVDDASCAGAACGDDAAGDACVKQAIPYPGGIDPYGITVDFNQRVWTANYGSSSVARYDFTAPRASRWVVTPVGHNCHGIAADGEGWVWAACDNNGVHRLSMTDPMGMNAVVAGTPGPYAKGMAVDFDGKIWAINLTEGNATVIVPGPGLGDYTITTDVNDTPLSRYTYSDMTGQQLRLATSPRGYYRRVFEGCADTSGTSGTAWGELRWEADAPPGTTLTWRVRTAATRADLAAATWILVATVPPAASPADVAAALAGAGVEPQRFLEVEVRLESMRDSTTEVITPRVFSMTVTHTCPPTIG